MSPRAGVPTYEEVLRELQDEFLTLLPGRVAELRSSLDLCETDAAARVTVQRIGHRLGGTAATVGLDEVGAVGQLLERFAVATDWSVEAIGRARDVVALLDAWTLEALRPGAVRPRGVTDDPRVAALRALTNGVGA